jgi:dTDP-4-dehydrorhamnose 3,5-epimerase
VNCLAGYLFEVVVDLRPQSPTFLQWESFEFGADPGESLYIPAGCAHGWQALTDVVDVGYWIDAVHDPSADVTIRFDDPDLAVPWPLPPERVSQRDLAAPALAEALAEIRSWGAP